MQQYDTELKVIETELLKEKEGRLILNQQARIAAVQVTDEDKKLPEEIKRENRGQEKVNGLIKIPKSLEKRILEHQQKCGVAPAARVALVRSW